MKTPPGKLPPADVGPGVQLIHRALLDQVRSGAMASPRRRMHHNLHGSLEENPNRLLNVLLWGTYIAPHRHLDPPKAEAFLVLEGRIAFFTFEQDGAVQGCHLLGPGELSQARGAVGIDLAPGVWHTLLALTPHATCFEVKPGPYLAQTDKEFAPWAPREGEPGVGEYMAQLLSQVDGVP